jgi:hypothetical protein
MKTQMHKGVCLALLLLASHTFSDEALDDAVPQDRLEDAYADYGFSEGITIYGDTERIARENAIIAALNKGQKERERFIEDELLKKSGFRRTANVKFRKTTGAEKAVSVLQSIYHAILLDLFLGFLGSVPQKPFLEEEYDRLPRGEFYNFYAVLINSDLKNVSLAVQKVMEAEYTLQIKFSNGAAIENWNAKYYTEENVEKFEQLIVSLPDSTDDFRRIKERFLTIELPRVKSALFRYLNPDESYIQARNNLSDIIKNNN